MHCPTCNSDNPVDLKFCGHCGSPLPQVCSACGFENPSNFNFCGHCGAKLRIEKEKPERRQLTVLFCDLIGSTALSEQLDPEDLRDVVRAYQEAAAEVVERYDGYIAQYLGDGILVYFGYPTAQENDPQRAVLTGLGIIEEMKNLNIKQQPLQALKRSKLALAVRIGVHTGLVVVGEVGTGERREQLALGETTNIAARLQDLAGSNTLVISAVTHRLVDGFFACRPLGFQRLRGISRPLEVYRVLRQSRARDRLDAAEKAMTGLTPLVGRESEMRKLLNCWQQAKEGRGQVVLLTGEAGIGKSRLARVFKEHLTGQAHLWFVCHCSPFHQTTAFYPIVELLQRVFRFKPNDRGEQKLSKLANTLKLYDLPVTDTVPLLTDLLSLPLPESYAPLSLTPSQHKRKMVETFLIIFLKLTTRRPVVILVEDLHWVDPSTVEMLKTLVEQAQRTQVLVIFTFRPMFSPPWPPAAHLTEIPLQRLSPRQSELLAIGVAKGKQLPPELLKQIIDKADGVPIFIEELTKMVLGLGLLVEGEVCYELSGPLPEFAVPSSLNDSLMARIDRLGTVREVTQLGAVLGREFDYKLLRAVAPITEIALQRALAELVQEELLYRSGSLPEARYQFKHALIQEAAYRSLLRRQRQYYHQRVAHILAEQFPDTAHQEPELLARHFSAAALHAEAARAWQQAGERAVRQSASLEAVIHFKKALEALDLLPPSPQRDQQELAVRVALGSPLLMSKGYTSPEVEANYARARQLGQRLDQTPQWASVLCGLWVFYLVRGEYKTALELGHELARIAEQTDNPTVWLEAHRVQGFNFFNLGQLDLAKMHLEKALAIYEPDQHGARVLADTGTDRGVACLSHLALVLWLLGYPDQALVQSDRAVELAGQLAHPYSLAFAWCWAAWLRQLRQETEPSLAMAEASRTLCFDHDFKLLELIASIVAGWATAAQGRIETGLGQLRQKLNDFDQTGAQLGHLHFWVLLADTYLRAGQIDAGLAVVEQALAKLPEKGERFYEAELHRLKGELLLCLGEPAADAALLHQAEACFNRAIVIAAGQQLRAFELKAALSLARLQGQQGRLAAARDQLAAVTGQFTEGRDTADVQQALALLDKLVAETK